MPSHFLVQIDGSNGYPNVTQNSEYGNDLWANRPKDQAHGEVRPGDTLWFYCTQGVPGYSMSLALSASVKHVSEGRVDFALDNLQWFSNPLPLDRIRQLVEQGTLDETFRRCGVQGFNICRLEPHVVEQARPLLETSDVIASEGPPGPSGSPVDALIETKLEDWIVKHWKSVDFGFNAKLYREDGEDAGRQYDTREVGRIDLLCEDENSNDFVVIELKRGRTSDQAIGQLARYMGWVDTKLANGRSVRGIILASEFDAKLRYAARMIPRVQLLRYETKFEIHPEPSLEPLTQPRT